MVRRKQRYRKKHSGLKALVFLFLICLVWFGTGEPQLPQFDEYIPSATIALRDSRENTEILPSTFSEETVPVTATETPPTVPEGSSFEIHYIDVGQASAALILCDGKAMLLDAGDTDCASLIYSYLKKMAVSYLDALVVTHGHADHCGGAAAALHAATAGTVYCSITEFDSYAFKDFTDAVTDQGLSLTLPSPGDTFYLGSALVEFLGPIFPSEEPNNMSIILRITYGNTRFLFSGDAELDAENAVLDAGYDISCDVICVGHHGSYTSSGYRWLREAKAKYAVISCGAGNEYGHPHDVVMSRLMDADLTVYRTDLQGDVICRSDGTNLTLETEK